MTFQTVYEVTSDWAILYWLTLVVEGVFVGWLIIQEFVILNKRNGASKIYRIFMGYIVLPLFIVTFSAGFISTGNDIFNNDPQNVIEPYKRGEYYIAEGVVKGVEGTTEVFWVDDIFFEPAHPLHGEIGYGSSMFFSWDIRAGEYVRIAYIPYKDRNIIVRIDLPVEDE